MTVLLGLLRKGLGPAGIAALLVSSAIVARAYLGKVGALAVDVAELPLVATSPTRPSPSQSSPMAILWMRASSHAFS